MIMILILTRTVAGIVRIVMTTGSVDVDDKIQGIMKIVINIIMEVFFQSVNSCLDKN